MLWSRFAAYGSGVCIGEEPGDVSAGVTVLTDYDIPAGRGKQATEAGMFRLE